MIRGASRQALKSGEQQLAALVASTSGGGLAVASELYAVSDALAESTALCRLLADPAYPTEAKDQVLQKLFGGKLSAGTVDFMRELVAERWSADADLPEVVEQLARDAALTAAANDGHLDVVERELFELADVMQRGDAEAREFLANPEIDIAERVAVVDKLLGDQVDPVTLRLAERAVERMHGRSYVASLREAANSIAARKDRQVAQVTSAIALTQAQKQRLEHILERKYGYPIEVYVSIDPDIIGGLKIVVGPDVIDDTVPARLQMARAAMVA